MTDGAVAPLASSFGSSWCACACAFPFRFAFAFAFAFAFPFMFDVYMVCMNVVFAGTAWYLLDLMGRSGAKQKLLHDLVSHLLRTDIVVSLKQALPIYTHIFADGSCQTVAACVCMCKALLAKR
jgi:hypothetical protein